MSVVTWCFNTNTFSVAHQTKPAEKSPSLTYSYGRLDGKCPCDLSHGAVIDVRMDELQAPLCCFDLPQSHVAKRLKDIGVCVCVCVYVCVCVCVWVCSHWSWILSASISQHLGSNDHLQRKKAWFLHSIIQPWGVQSEAITKQQLRGITPNIPVCYCIREAFVMS